MNTFDLFDEIEKQINHIRQLQPEKLEENQEIIDKYCRSLIKLMPYGYKRALYKNTGLVIEAQSNNMDEIATIENDITAQSHLKFLGFFKAVYSRNPIPLRFEEITGKKYDPEIHIAFEIYRHSAENKEVMGGFYTFFAIYELI